MSNDPAQEYFSDGMTEELTSTLAKLSSLFVIARNSAFTYKPFMRRGLTLSDEKPSAARYTTAGSGVAEVESPWCLQPVDKPDPRTVFRHLFLLPLSK